MELRLLPKRPFSWVIWALLLVIFLPRYYSVFPFPQLIFDYERQMWTQPKEISVGDNWVVTVRAPKVIGDFTDGSMSVAIRNKQSSPASAELSVSLECQDGDNHCQQTVAYRRVQVRSSTQNSVYLEDIPPNGEVTTWFDLRAVVTGDAPASPSLVAEVLVDGDRVTQRDETFLATFDRDRMFRLWAIENLLSPPGSNIVVPIFFLFIVVLAEIVTDVVVMLRSSDDRGERIRWIAALLLVLVVVSVFLLLTRPIVDLGPFFSDDPLNVRLRHAVFGFVMGAVGLGIVFGCFASTRKHDPSKACC